MKKRDRPAMKRQSVTIRSFYNLHPQVTNVGANPHGSVTIFDNLVEKVHVLGVVDNGLFAVGVYCNALP